MTTCQVCGAETADDDVITLEGRRVCAACKPRVLQQIKEGSLDPLPFPPIELAERELGIQALIAVSWKIVCRDWRAILALELLVAIPGNWILSFFDPGENGGLYEYGSYFRVAQAVETLIGVVAALGIAQIVNARVQGRSLSFGAALFHAVRRWLPGIGTNFLASLCIGLLLLLLIVPGVIYLVAYAFVIPVVALRETSGTRALAYSKTLVQGRWWRVAGRLFGLFLVPATGIFLVGMALSFAPESRALSFTTETVNDLFFAFMRVGTAVLFLNLDAVVRREPLNAITLGSR